MSACLLVQSNELKLYQKPEKEETAYLIEKLDKISITM